MRIALLGLFIAWQVALCAQEAKQGIVSLTYFGGQLTHPGMKVAWGKCFSNGSKVKTRRSGKEKAKSRRWIGSLNAAAQIHYKYRTAVLLYPEIMRRYQNENTGWYKQFGLGLGYQRSFQKDVYRVDNGEAARVTLAGDHQAVMILSTGVGKDMSVRKSRNLRWYAGPALSVFGPGFNWPNSYLFMEAGISVNLRNNE